MANHTTAGKPDKPRSPNGAGSLYWTNNHNGRSGWIYQTSTWDPDKRRSRYIRGFGASPQIAYQRHAELVQKRIKQGSSNTPKTVTLAKYLEIYLNDIQPRIGDQTYRKYKTDITTHILPTLGKKQIGKITKEDYHNLFYKVLDTTGTSARYHAYKTLSGMLNHAVNNGVIEQNVLKRVPTPQHMSKVKKFDDKYASRRASVSINLLKWLSEPDNKYADHRNRILFMFLGLRRGELLGMEWDSITSIDKANNAKLTINRTLNRHEPHTGQTGYYIQPYTKTKTDRKIILPEPFRKALLNERKKGRTAKDPQFKDLVFLNQSGAPYTWGYHDRMWREILTAYYNKDGKKYDKLPEDHYFRPHAVRHLTATFLYMSGVQARDAAEFLGHSTDKMTEHYTHLMDEGKLNTSKSLAAQLRL